MARQILITLTLAVGRRSGEALGLWMLGCLCTAVAFYILGLVLGIILGELIRNPAIACVARGGALWQPRLAELASAAKVTAPRVAVVGAPPHSLAHDHHDKSTGLTEGNAA